MKDACAASMARMLSRALGLALLVLALGAPSAGAEVADRFMPVYDASDGVRVVRSSTGEPLVRFGPKAASIYRAIRGRRAMIGCGGVEPERLGGSGLVTTGFMSGTFRLPRRRGPVRTWTDGDVGFIATRAGKDRRGCMALSETDTNWCARVIVAVTDPGAAYLDAHARALELSRTIIVANLALGVLADKAPIERARLQLGTDDVVALASPDASPPAGQVGYWTDGKAGYAAVALLRDGGRVFARFADGVFSTNVPGFIGFDDDANFTVF
jgi:hypothetical protein